LGLYEGFSRNVPLEETTGVMLREADETSLPPFQVQGQMITIPPRKGVTISLGKVVARDFNTIYQSQSRRKKGHASYR